MSQDRGRKPREWSLLRASRSQRACMGSSAAICAVSVSSKSSSRARVTPERRRRPVRGEMDDLLVSERRACLVLGQSRAVQRHTPIVRDDEDVLTRRIIELAAVYGKYGMPRTAALLRREG